MGITREVVGFVVGAGPAVGPQIQIYHCTGFGNPAQVWSFSP
jgi:hypothetical protein